MLSSSAHSGERSPYMDSVLYLGDRSTSPGLRGVSGDFDPFIPDPPPVDSVAAEADPTTTVSSAPGTAHVLPDSAIESGSGSFAGTMLAALVGGAAVGYGAGAIGYGMDEDGGGEWDGVGGAIAGFTVGNALGSATAAHLANGGRGSFGSTLLVSTLTALFLPTALFAGPAGWAAAAFGQAALVAGVERSTAKKRAREAAEQRASPEQR